MNETEKIIARTKFKYGMELILYDRSEVLTGDRWHIDILCRSYIPLADSYWETVAAEGSRQQHAIRKMLGEGLVFNNSKKELLPLTGKKRL